MRVVEFEHVNWSWNLTSDGNMSVMEQEEDGLILLKGT